MPEWKWGSYHPVNCLVSDHHREREQATGKENQLSKGVVLNWHLSQQALGGCECERGYAIKKNYRLIFIAHMHKHLTSAVDSSCLPFVHDTSAVPLLLSCQSLDSISPTVQPALTPVLANWGTGEASEHSTPRTEERDNRQLQLQRETSACQ